MDGCGLEGRVIRYDDTYSGMLIGFFEQSAGGESGKAEGDGSLNGSF
jgi:hypothetical protein